MHYGLLGPIEVRDGDRLIKVGGPQQQRLLAVLLAQPGQVIENLRLIDVLWPDDLAPDAAAHSVLTYVHRLRSAIGSGAIVTHGSGYAFDPASGDIDVDEFEALVAQARASGPDTAIALYDQALALWRGRAFGRFGDEWWAVPVTARLNELRIVAAEERAAGLIATGNRARAVPELRALVVGHPLRERPVCLLAQALHGTGRQAEALRELAAFRARLGDSGLDPSNGVIELERSIAAGDALSGPGAGGRPLRGYVLHDAIGEGAFGRVYVATQPGTDRMVAVKVIRPELADSEAFVSRFEAEAQLVARMEHPHIVPLYDYWREPGGAYLVFRLLKRSASASLITGGPWSLAHVSRLVEEVGGALLTAHTLGVQHGDVRTANVLLDDAGNTYLTDFGIAVSGNADRTTTDIRDFAAMLWELLAGTPPNGSRGSVGHAERTRRLPSLAGRVSGVPDSIDAVIGEAMDEGSGFASMAELILAWRAAVGRPEGVVTPLSYEHCAGESARRLAARQLIVESSAGINPYRGLRPFGEADAARYFGRDTVVDALVDVVGREHFVAVVGASGSGKSSVLHAGLVPRLRRDPECVVATMVPGDRPLGALRDALREVAVAPIRARAPSAVIAAVAGSAAGDLVLVIDQLEECWTMASTVDRDEFLTVLANAATSTSGPSVRVVVAVRADFYDRPLQHRGIGQLVGAGTFALASMSPAELEDAVLLPAAQAGVHFDDGVAAAIVADAVARPGVLPMLQFTLTELYARRVDGRISAAALDGLGGIAGAVGRRAEEVYNELDDAGRAGARELFARLVTPGEGAADTRRRARLGELSETARATADRFVAARLLVSDRESDTREPVVELAHEALLTRWPRLRAWIDEDRRWLTQLQHLAVSARSWDEAARPDGELYRGARLEAAVEALPNHSRELTEVEVAFVEAGRAARDSDRDRERRSARRVRRLLGAVATALVVAVLTGGVAVVQRGRSQQAARVARAGARAAELARINTLARTMTTDRADLGLLLGVAAQRMAPSIETEGVLEAALVRTPPGLERILPLDGSTLYPTASPDGRLLVFVTGGDVHLLDLQSGRLIRTLHSEHPFDNAFFNDDGTQLATSSSAGGTNAFVTVRDTASGQQLGAPMRTRGTVVYGEFDPGTPSDLYTISSDGEVVRWDRDNPAHPKRIAVFRFQPETNNGSASVIAASADGRLLAASPTSPDSPTTSVWDVHHHQLLHTFAGFPVGFAADRVTLLVSNGPNIEFRNARIGTSQGQPIHAPNIFPYAPMTRDRRRLAAQNENGTIAVYNLRTRQRIGTPLDVPPGSYPTSFLPDGRLIVNGHGQTSIWRIGASVSALGIRITDHGHLVSAGFIGSGDRVVTNSLKDSKATIWDAATGRRIAVIAGSPVQDVGRDGKHALVALRGGVIGVWDVATNRQVGTIPTRLGPTDVSTFSPNGSLVAINANLVNDRIGEPVNDPPVELWDVSHPTSPILIRRFVVPAARGNMNEGFSDDGRSLVAVDYDASSITLFDVASGQRRWTRVLDGAALWQVTMSPDSATIAAADNGTGVQFLDARTGEPRRMLPLAQSLFGLAYLNGGRVIAAGTEISTGGATQLFDVATLAPIGIPLPLPHADAFLENPSPDSSRVAAGTRNGFAVIWDVNVAHWQQIACNIAGRNLSHSEWHRYLPDQPYRRTCPQWP